MTIAAIPSLRPRRAVRGNRTGKTMDVILHIGAHRCATTSFQAYMRRNATSFMADGTGFWGPKRTRNGLFCGVVPGGVSAPVRNPRRRAAGRIRMQLDGSARQGVRLLVVSDENIMGNMRRNLHDRALYAGAGQRLSHFGTAFGGRVTRVAVNIRALDLFWSSALGYGLTRAHPLPDSQALADIAENRRGWREVIEDVACALPDTPITVMPFERFAGRPDRQLSAMTGGAVPTKNAQDWLNATPKLARLRRDLPEEIATQLPAGEGRWLPFSPAQAARLRGVYAEDLSWLMAGADGLAQLAVVPNKTTAEKTPPQTDLTRGRPHDQDQQGRLAGAG
ncbi:hypothetical protein [Primorskyibacter sp. S87]|uniref:hypothetical protein n=1 Tax=Primorskyibacter sp. S87 TaxID=3415126 RepID=UPI003C7CD831